MVDNPKYRLKEFQAAIDVLLNKVPDLDIDDPCILLSSIGFMIWHANRSVKALMDTHQPAEDLRHDIKELVSMLHNLCAELLEDLEDIECG